MEASPYPTIPLAHYTRSLQDLAQMWLSSLGLSYFFPRRTTTFPERTHLPPHGMPRERMLGEYELHGIRVPHRTPQSKSNLHHPRPLGTNVPADLEEEPSFAPLKQPFKDPGSAFAGWLGCVRRTVGKTRPS